MTRHNGAGEWQDERIVSSLDLVLPGVKVMRWINELRYAGLWPNGVLVAPAVLMWELLHLSEMTEADIAAIVGVDGWDCVIDLEEDPFLMFGELMRGGGDDSA
jgi:hypothetical protein